MAEEENKNDRANEPNADYLKANIPLSQIFKSITISTLEKQQEEMLQYSASLTHLQRMEHLQELIRIAYAHILNDSSLNLWDKKIYLDKPE